MKHHCHCGFREHFRTKNIRKLGWLGVTFMVLHLLFHVVECLLLPSIIVAIGGHLNEEPAAAIAAEEQLSTDDASKVYMRQLPNLCSNVLLCDLELTND